MIFARMTSRYGDVYRRARTVSASRSAAVKWTTYGLVLGIGRCPSPEKQRATFQSDPSTVIRHRIYEHRYLGSQISGIDVLFAEVDASGAFRRFVLVEDKLLRNPEAKRTVLAQILDYAHKVQYELT